MPTLKLITYGCGERFSVAKFQPIKNRQWIKPDGGLWASPIDSERGWKDWCEAEDFRVSSLQQSFMFMVETSKIFVIDSVNDARKMPWIQAYPGLSFKVLSYPDFESMAKIYDGIWLTERGQYATRFSEPSLPSLYGWDCESVLIMNLACIKECEHDK